MDTADVPADLEFRLPDPLGGDGRGSWGDGARR